MPDEIDLAQRLETIQRNHALEAMRRTVRHLNQAQGRDDCEDCGFDIPEDRKAILPGATRCTPCQQIHDNKHSARR